MIDTRTMHQIKKVSVTERIQIIELILETLKKDVKTEFEVKKSQFKPFKIRKFSLGEEVHVDREQLYAERGL